MAGIELYGPQILSVLDRKGWNAYRSNLQVEADETIKRGAVSSLEIGQRYVLFPKIVDHDNPSAVLSELERLAIKLNRVGPTIDIDGKKWAWTGFKPLEDSIKVITEIGHYLFYSHFIFCLESTVDINAILR